jgi:hypothetical protein
VLDVAGAQSNEASAQCSIECVLQYNVAEWFKQAIYGAGLKQRNSLALIFMRGDEDDGNLLASPGKLFLQLRAGHAGHGDVQNEAVSLLQPFGRKELAS